MSETDSAENEYIGDELALFAHAHNWKRYWSSKIRPLLGNTVLDVGAGLGANLFLLMRPDQRWTALEPDPGQAAQISERCKSEGMGASVITGTLQDLPAEQQFESLIYIDVLEHIEDHAGELRHALSHVETGGTVVVLSPAHQSLFSPFDHSVGHYRRYNKRSLAAIKPQGSEIEQLYYLDSVGCIASWVNAKIMKSGMPTRSQIWLWDSVMVPLSRVFDRLFAHRVGKTIIMVLRKT